MVDVGVNECDNTINGRNQFVFLIFVHLLLIGLNGTNAQNRAPRIKEHPSNTVSGRSEPATLRCVVEGRPKPIVQWYKDGLPLPPAEDGHRVLLEDGLLFLRINRGKKEGDEGIYWCMARNIAGEAISHNASLNVAVLRDDFRAEPSNSIVAAGEPAILECSPPRGIPEPSVYWVKNNQIYDVELNGRVTVTDTGNLKILETLPSDNGVYRCVATNIAGERQSRIAGLIVLKRPHFIVKPNNITTLVGQTVEFNCQSYDSNVKITWVKEDGSLPSHASIIRGLLRLEHVSASDAGVYSCRADSNAGSSITSATLTVNSLPHFTQIPSNLTAWEGDVVSIPCEARGLPTPTTFWILEGNQDSLLFPECTKSNTSLLYLDGAKPEHSGRVICTAVNAAGSIMQEAYLTVLKKNNNDLKESSLDQDSSIIYDNEARMTQYELVQSRKYLQQNVLVMRRVEALSSTSLKVVWDVLTDYNEYLEGVKIWYNGTTLNWKNVTNEEVAILNSSHSGAIVCSNGSLTNVDNSGSSSYILSGLMAYTQYDIFLMPFYKMLLGKPSNLMTGYTDGDVPSAPPQSVTAGVINATSAWIRWEPPPANTWNGELTGYLIEIRVSGSTGGRVVGQMSLGPRTRAAAASSLRSGGRYTARAAAVTSKGHGPFSAPAQIHMLPTQSQRHYVQTEPPQDGNIPHILQETWLLALGLILFSVIVIGLFSIYYIKRRNGIQRKKSNGQSIVTAQQCLLNKDTIWLRDRPVFASANDPTLDVTSCNQSLLHGGQSTSILSVEPEYSLPQNSIQGLDASSVDRIRRGPPEPYASSAIYTELNFKDNNEMDVRNCSERRSHNNSIVRSCNGSIQYSNGECSTCCHSTSSRSTKDYREPRHEMVHNEINVLEDDCVSCHTNRSGSRSRQDKSKVCPANDLEYDYPQWHWLGRENSFKIPMQTSRHSNVARSEQGCQINLCDILPPPPYESPESKNN
ncbi:LOW QUALITY PROTEIN: netrin receptor DCC-like [Galleria mellonella]|uniref:LOW QUALITY PROTEIN: netrin receptor DCC-like n=1 Tax=Galleria mellonella TaxID=7137 RepID=A0A6J1X204_GALME|nr:LOW QUALITY PROTEIN: netrin receptor DCC-like [Galleria mellonella]